MGGEPPDRGYDIGMVSRRSQSARHAFAPRLSADVVGAGPGIPGEADAHAYGQRVGSRFPPDAERRPLPVGVPAFPLYFAAAVQ